MIRRLTLWLAAALFAWAPVAAQQVTIARSAIVEARPLVHPGYVAGRYYPLAGSTNQTTSAMVSTNQMNLCPILLTQAITISELGLRITTPAASGHFEALIYASDAATRDPSGTPLVRVTGLVTDAAAFVTGAVSPAVTLAPGLYWGAVNTDTTTAQISIISNGSFLMQSIIGVKSSSNVQVSDTRFNYVLATAYGTQPNLTSTPAAENKSTSCPALYVKVSAVP